MGPRSHRRQTPPKVKKNTNTPKTDNMVDDDLDQVSFMRKKDMVRSDHLHETSRLRIQNVPRLICGKLPQASHRGPGDEVHHQERQRKEASHSRNTAKPKRRKEQEPRVSYVGGGALAAPFPRGQKEGLEIQCRKSNASVNPKQRRNATEHHPRRYLHHPS